MLILAGPCTSARRTPGDYSHPRSPARSARSGSRASPADPPQTAPQQAPSGTRRFRDTSHPETPLRGRAQSALPRAPSDPSSANPGAYWSALLGTGNRPGFKPSRNPITPSTTTSFLWFRRSGRWYSPRHGRTGSIYAQSTPQNMVEQNTHVHTASHGLPHRKKHVIGGAVVYQDVKLDVHIAAGVADLVGQQLEKMFVVGADRRGVAAQHGLRAE
ncbi:hypothetical protein FQR65_LT20363 [Abscondita terminalis]|nr:hypothetical protein FQR65_LT20363 [Abscondita terminalis]